jgi:arylsulfatase A-like enzyme
MWRIVSSTIVVLGLSGLCVAGFGEQGPFAQSAAPAPNIIVIIADDLGWQDTALPLTALPTALNQRFRTPNLLRLAADGVKFTDAYAAAPLCTPTRVAELTGRMPAETRVTHIAWLQDKDYTVLYPPPGPPVLISPDWNLNGLGPKDGVAHAYSGPVLPEILRRAGYRTIHIGKAHWAPPGTPGADPHAMGFDINVGGSGAGEPGSYLGTRNYRSVPQATVKMDVPGLEQYHGTDTFLTEALTIEANKAIDAAIAEKKPFFLHFAHFAVHTPIFQADQRFLGNYASSGLSLAETNYATLVEGLDKSLGDILANVTRRGVAENTLVIFTSDNGGTAEARNQIPSPFSQNAPLRSVKGSAYEGGLRVVQVMSWPGRIKGGSTNKTPVVTDDIFPTLLALARVPDRESLVRNIRGRDLMPMLTGGDPVSPDRPLLWHYPHPGGSGPGQEPFSALRVGHWKLIFFYKGRHYELYDLEKDLGESQNVLDTNPAIAARLSGILRDSLNRAKAQMPLDAATKIPVEVPPLVAGRASSR